MNQKQLTKGRFRKVADYLKSSALALFLTAAVLMPTPARAFMVDSTEYVFVNSPYDEPAYQIAKKAMDKIFKKYKETDPNPGIAIAEIDLNGDESSLEIIAYPLEGEEQLGNYCNNDELALCPNYILETRGDKTKTLGKIFARYVSRGEEIKNGYWTLKVYNKGEQDPKYFDNYIYDPEKDGYVLEPKQE